MSSSEGSLTPHCAVEKKVCRHAAEAKERIRASAKRKPWFLLFILSTVSRFFPPVGLPLAPFEGKATLWLSYGHPHMPRGQSPWKFVFAQSVCFVHIYAPAARDEGPPLEGSVVLRYSSFCAIRTMLLSHVRRRVHDSYHAQFDCNALRAVQTSVLQ